MLALTSSWPRLVPFQCGLIGRDASHFRGRMDRSKSAVQQISSIGGNSGRALVGLHGSTSMWLCALACLSNLSSGKYVTSYIPSGTWEFSQRQPTANMRRGFWRCDFIHIHSLSTCRDFFNWSYFLPCKPHPSSVRSEWLPYWWPVLWFDGVVFPLVQFLYLHVSVMEIPCGGSRLCYKEAVKDMLLTKENWNFNLRFVICMSRYAVNVVLDLHVYVIAYCGHNAFYVSICESHSPIVRNDYANFSPIVRNDYANFSCNSCTCLLFAPLFPYC